MVVLHQWGVFAEKGEGGEAVEAEAASDPSVLVGTWNWTPTEVVTVKAEGTMTSKFNGNGVWKKSGPNTFVLVWTTALSIPWISHQTDKRLQAETRWGNNQTSSQNENRIFGKRLLLPFVEEANADSDQFGRRRTG
jgi:hypothetical protein